MPHAALFLQDYTDIAAKEDRGVTFDVESMLERDMAELDKRSRA